MIQNQTFQSDNADQTKQLARRLSQQFIEHGPTSQALVLALTGGLGSGKTTFVKSFARELGVREKVLSPTFVILKKFEIPETEFETLYHIDCYRIEEPQQLSELNFREIVEDQSNLVVIEWADRVESILPEQLLEINFKIQDKNRRKINIKNKL